MLLACRVLLVCALAAALAGIAPTSALASINGDDYVGLTAVNDRGLNITEAPAIDAKYGILCDAEGNVLWSRSADTHSAMASLTKTMTAIVALENADLDDVFTVSKKAASIGESTTGLKEGMQVPLETLLNGMLVHSGNDCAITIAEGIGGDTDTFVGMMNQKAADMGLKNTHFEDPEGLDSANHYSSAADISVIVRYGMCNDTFRSIVSQSEVTLDLDGEQKTFMSTNALLGVWDDCIGIKTGFTNHAGECLAAAASKDGVELYAVVLGSSDESQRFIDAYKLLDWGYAHYRNYTLATSDQVLVDAPMSGYLNRTVKAGVADDVNAMVLDFDGDISVDVRLVDISDGVSAGQKVGTITWRQGEKVIASAPLLAKENVGAPMPWTSVWTATVRLIGLATGDKCIAESVLYAQTTAVEKAAGSYGQSIDSTLEKQIRAYVAAYNASVA